MSTYDTQGLYEFLTATPESGLRKILVDKTKMTDVHFGLLMKVVRAGDAEQFGVCFDKQEFPKIRLGPAETKLKEKFWGECTAVLLERGLLQHATAQKIAA